MIKIIVDCFGGDHCPEAPVEAAVKSLAANPDLHLILTGDETILRKCLEGKSYDASRLEIEHAPEVIGCDEKPTDVVRLKRNSSMMKGIIMLRDRDDIAAMVSTGSTGALVTGALVRLGRVPGVIRPAFCPILPTMDGGIVGICDSGANVEVTSAHLRQFAIMASLYMSMASRARALPCSTWVKRPKKETKSGRKPTSCCRRPRRSTSWAIWKAATS